MEAPVYFRGHLSLISAYRNDDRKCPAPVAGAFSASRGYPLTGASTVQILIDEHHLMEIDSITSETSQL